LGITGGVLISSLFLGVIKKFFIFDFRFNIKILKTLKEIGLLMFLSEIGLKYGYNTVVSLSYTNISLFIASFIIAFISIFTGFLCGRYILKLNWILLSGSLCGGMTSTPGLGAAIDSTSTDNVMAGYGSTYPSALLMMVLYTRLFNTLF